MVFLGFLATTLAAQLWLGWRQIRHVRAHRSAVPEAFRESISLDAHQKAADYTIAKHRLGLIDTVYGAAILLGWTLLGGLSLLDSLWTASGWGELWRGTAFLISLMVIGTLLELPVTLYNTFVVEQRFGFNRMTPGLFIADMAKGAVLMLAIGTPLLMAVLWLMQQAGEQWWLYVWLLWSGFNLLALWAYPTLIAPLFNKFEPLPEGSVRQRIQALLDRTGFRSRGIFVMDGSKRSAHGNAYFTGVGKAKRIVFFDTLLKGLSDTEIEAVLAHELGHFKLKHVSKRIVLAFAMSLVALWLLGWLIDQPWFYSGLGVTQPSTYMALALFMLVSPVFTFFLSPLMSWGSRKHEFEADAFAAKQANAGDLVTALVKMYKENAKTLTPDPVHSVFYDSHPPAPVRIAHLQQQHG
jgi:STE24 endopeptidase